MNRVLFITYFFPPDGGAGTQRPAKFCKYLADFGWQPVVITRRLSGSRSAWDPDPGLLSDIGETTKVVRVQQPELPSQRVTRALRVKQLEAWLDRAFDSSMEEIRKGGIDVVLVTMSPFALARLGQRLKRATRIPVVYDLRDPWALDGWPRYRSRSQWRKAMESMTRTLRDADGVIANTPEAKLAMQREIAELVHDRVVVIPNGYDPEDFEDDAPVPVGLEADKFNIVHAGSLHSNALLRRFSPRSWAKQLLTYRPEPIQPSGRTPKHLLAAVRALEKQGHPSAARCRIIFVGRKRPADVRLAKVSGINGRVVFTGYVSHQECLGWMRHADALFLSLHGLPPGRRSLIVPGKTYEYLATGRPIVGCLPEGDARDLVERSRLGFCAHPCRSQEIAAALERLWAARQAEHPFERTVPAWLERFDRRFLTEKLARYLDRIVGSADSAGTEEPEGCCERS